MAELDQMIGLAPVKDQIRQLTASVEAAHRRLAAGYQTEKPLQHFVFLGPPGTGKTSVARIIAKLYYACGLLDSPTVVEAQRADLVGEYLGATAIKTNDLIDSAARRGAVHRRGLQPGQRWRGARGQVRQRGGPGAAQARRGRQGQPRGDPGRVPAADGGLPGQQPGAELAVPDAGPVRRVHACRACGPGADRPGAARGVAGRRGAAQPDPDDGGRRPPAAHR